MRRLLTLIALSCALLAGRVALADGIRTDVNIVTGLDLSGSIEAPEAQLQMEGIAMAIRSPQIIAAIHYGAIGRIGFALFVWADGSYPVLGAWRVISTPEEAVAVSEEVASRLRAIRDSDIVVRLGALTDVSGAIDYGRSMLQSAPFDTNHRIINIVAKIGYLIDCLATKFVVLIFMHCSILVGHLDAFALQVVLISNLTAVRIRYQLK